MPSQCAGASRCSATGQSAAKRYQCAAASATALTASKVESRESNTRRQSGAIDRRLRDASEHRGGTVAEAPVGRRGGLAPVRHHDELEWARIERWAHRAGEVARQLSARQPRNAGTGAVGVGAIDRRDDDLIDVDHAGSETDSGQHDERKAESRRRRRAEGVDVDGRRRHDGCEEIRAEGGCDGGSLHGELDAIAGRYVRAEQTRERRRADPLDRCARLRQNCRTSGDGRCF